MSGQHTRVRHPGGSGMAAGGVVRRSTHVSGGVDVTVTDPYYGSPNFDVDMLAAPDIPAGIIDGNVHIFPGSLTAPLFAESLVVPQVLDALPALPDVNYPQGSLVFLTTDQKLWRNTDGSTWSLAVDGADILANSIVAGSIAAGAIGAQQLAAEIILGSLIKTASGGARIEMDINGLRSYNAAEDLEVQIPTDGSAVYVKGQVQATELLVLGDAVLRGAANALSAGSVTILEAAQSDPTQAPTLAQDWDTETFPTDVLYDYASDEYYRAGLDYSAAGGAGGATKVFYTVAASADARHYLLELKATDRTVNRAALVASIDDTEGAFSACKHGSFIYVIKADFLLGSYFVDRYALATLAFDTHYGSVSFPYASPRSPVICSDGTNIFIVDKSNTGTIKWNKYDASMVKVGSTIDTTYNPGTGYLLVDAAAGNHDFGAFRISVYISNSGKVQHFDSSGARQADEEFPVAHSLVNYGGVTYGDALGDGARFWSHGASGEVVKMEKHTTWTWTSASSKYWVAYSWYDSVATTHETLVGPRASITMGRRKRLTVTTAELPGGGGADEPDKRRIYMFPNASAPATTSLDLQTTSIDATARIRTYDNTGAAPPVTNDFPGATPGELRSAAGEWSLKGDGTSSFSRMLDYAIDTTDNAFTTEETLLSLLNVPVAAGRLIKITGHVAINPSAAGQATIRLKQEGVQVGFWKSNFGSGNSADNEGATVVAIVSSGAGGTLDYIMTGEGSVSMSADGSTIAPTTLLVEDIGPA